MDQRSEPRSDPPFSPSRVDPSNVPHGWLRSEGSAMQAAHRLNFDDSRLEQMCSNIRICRQRDRYECTVLAFACHILFNAHAEEIHRLDTSAPILLPSSSSLPPPLPTTSARSSPRSQSSNGHRTHHRQAQEAFLARPLRRSWPGCLCRLCLLVSEPRVTAATRGMLTTLLP